MQNTDLERLPTLTTFFRRLRLHLSPPQTSISHNHMNVKSYSSAVVLIVALLMVGCRTGVDTSRLSPDGQRLYRNLEVARVVNDVSQGAILANATGALSEAETAAVLTINKQVLDYLEENPQGAWSQAAVIARNARDALPPAIQVQVAQYVEKVLGVLEGVR